MWKTMEEKMNEILAELPDEVTLALALCGGSIGKGCYWGIVDAEDWEEEYSECIADSEHPNLLDTIDLGKKVLVVADTNLLLGGISMISSDMADKMAGKMEVLNEKARARLYSRLGAIIKHVVDTGQVSQKLLLGLYSNNMGDYLSYGKAGQERRVLGYQCTFNDFVELIPYVLNMFPQVPLHIGFELQDGSTVLYDELLEYLDKTKGRELRVSASNGDNGILSVLVISRG